MKELHRAALKRAYRTLAQGLGSSGVLMALTAVVAALGDSPDVLRTTLLTAGISLATTVITSFGSFWQGVAGGLPEAGLETKAPTDGEAYIGASDVDDEADPLALLDEDVSGA